MTILTPTAMQTLHGAGFPRPPRGVGCGFLMGLTFGLAFTGRFVAASLVYMVTPTACLFDVAL
jgi:hypothetical protein